jgi:hypothetical protein
MRPLFLVCHVLSWRERYMRNYVFAFYACGWGLVLSTKLLAGKVCFYVFMCFENKPVDKALGGRAAPNVVGRPRIERLGRGGVGHNQKRDIVALWY